MVKTKEDFINEFVTISNNSNKAKENLAKSIREYEEEIRRLQNDMRTLLYEATLCDEIPAKLIATMASKKTELDVIAVRFNGLKCELT